MIETTSNSKAEPLGLPLSEKEAPTTMNRIKGWPGRDTLTLAQKQRSFWGTIVDYFWSAWEWIKGAFSSLFSENTEYRGVLQELRNLKNDFREFCREYDGCSSVEERQIVIKKFQDEFNILQETSQKEIREQVLSILREYEPEESNLYYTKRLNHIMDLDPFYVMADSASKSKTSRVVFEAIIRHYDDVISKSEQIGE